MAERFIAKMFPTPNFSVRESSAEWLAFWKANAFIGHYYFSCYLIILRCDEQKGTTI